MQPTSSLWEFEDFLPVSRRVSLGEGNTLQIQSEQWGTTFKLEYISPSASFKDRGTTTMLSRALDLEVTKIIDDSSGNAGSSIAQYAAKAGITAEIFVPASIPDGKRAAIESMGAEIIPIEGSREDVRDACLKTVAEDDVWYASHTWRPSFITGMKTFAYEIAIQNPGSTPDVVVLPLGAGTLLLGAYYGFRDLVELGVIDTIPRIMGGQATGYTPIVDSLHGTHSSNRNDLADGLHIQNPPRKSQILEAIEETNGDAIAVSENETEDALNRLHRSGFYVEPSSAVAAAALTKFKDQEEIRENDDVVVALSGSGLNAL